MKTAKLQEINYLRAFGVFLVLMIHASSAYYYLDSSSLTYKIWGAINNLSLPAVPLFLFISALTLAYSSSQREKRGEPFLAGAFYKRRLDKILLPYLCWTVLYLLFRFAMGESLNALQTAPLSFIGNTLLLGKGYYHLYYMVIAMQLYLLFPLLMLLRRRIRLGAAASLKALTVLFLSLCLLQYAAMLLGYKVIYPLFPYVADLLLPYLLPVGMGLWFGFNMERLDTALVKLRLPIVLGFVLMGTLSVMQGVFGRFVLSSEFIMLVRMIYALFTALTFLLLCRRIREWSAASRLLKPIGEYSFFIYLAHPLFLTVAEKYLHLRGLVTSSVQMLNFSCGVALCLLFSLFCALLCGFICRRLKLQRFFG